MSGTVLQWECHGATCYGTAGRHTVATILPSGTPDSPTRLLWGCLGRSDIAHGMPAAQAACQAAWEAFVAAAGLVPAGTQQAVSAVYRATATDWFLASRASQGERTDVLYALLTALRAAYPGTCEAVDAEARGSIPEAPPMTRPAEVFARASAMAAASTRPRRPPGLPHRGDDNRVWDAWRHACRDCRHSGPAGCERYGVIEHARGDIVGLPTGPGGCSEWSPRMPVPDVPRVGAGTGRQAVPPSGEGGDTGPLYRWRWRARLPERRGELFRVLARGKLNACLIRFEADGAIVVTSRNALRRA